MQRIERDQPVITLVNVPPHERSDLDRPIAKDIYTKFPTPAVGLAGIHSVLRNEGYKNVQTIDPRFYLDYGKFTKSDWELFAKSDIIGITSMTRTREVSLRFIELVKEINPNAVIIAGGVDPTFNPEKWLAGGKSADYVVGNEGEVTIVELMKIIKNGNCPENTKGISYKKDGQITHNEKRPLLTEGELSKIPIPFFPKYIEKNSYTHVVESSRGCPNKCNFCCVTELYKGTYRRKSDETTIAQIQNSKEGKRVFFVDDNFAHPSRLEDAKRTMQSIIDAGLNNREFSLQLDTVSVNRDPEFIRLCVKMNVFMVFLGIESIDPSILKNMRKSATADQNKNAAQIFLDHKIYPHGMEVAGSKGETPETLDVLLKWLLESGIPSIQIFPETPTPGSKLAKEKEIFPRANKDTNLISGHFVVSRPPDTFTCFELQQKIFNMYREFYSLRHIGTELRPLRWILSDPIRALKLTLMNIAARSYARKELSSMKKNKYYQEYMEYLKQMDNQIVKEKEQEISDVQNEGVVFDSTKP